MKNIPNLDYRFEELMHNVVELCICSVEPRTIVFVCLPGDELEIQRKIKVFMRDRHYGVSHFVSTFRRDPALRFENESNVNILAHENEWLGRSFTDMVMFCRPEDLDSEIKLCVAGSVYCVAPNITVLTDANPKASKELTVLRRLR